MDKNKTTDGKEIWIVSSEPQLPDLIKNLITEQSHNYTIIKSSGAAVELINDTVKKPHLIITDNKIGEDDAGMEVLKEARKARIPSIILSGRDIENQAKAVNPDSAFIKKPFESNTQFTNAVERLLSETAEHFSGRGR